MSISLIQSSYPQQCCRLTEHCDVAVLLINCRLLEPVGSFIPDNAAFTAQTDHIIMGEIETEVHYTSLSWRWRQCLLLLTFKVTVVRTQNLIQGKIYACNPESHRSCINRKSALSYNATSTGIRSTLKQLPSILHCWRRFTRDLSGEIIYGGCVKPSVTNLQYLHWLEFLCWHGKNNSW